MKADQPEAKIQIKQQIARVYEENRYLLDGDLLSGNEKKAYNEVNLHMGDAEAAAATGRRFTTFVRSLFNATFKTNPYLERAMMTGITRVSKEVFF